MANTGWYDYYFYESKSRAISLDAYFYNITSITVDNVTTTLLDGEYLKYYFRLDGGSMPYTSYNIKLYNSDGTVKQTLCKSPSERVWSFSKNVTMVLKSNAFFKVTCTYTRSSQSDYSNSLPLDKFVCYSDITGSITDVTQAYYKLYLGGNRAQYTAGMERITGNFTINCYNYNYGSEPEYYSRINGTLTNEYQGNVIRRVYGNNTTYKIKEIPSGYSGNILANEVSGYAIGTIIKFDTPPSNDNDYDAFASPLGQIDGLTSYSDKTKVYAWGYADSGSPKVIINNVETEVSTSYATPTEITLTGNYDIYLGYRWGTG